MKRIFKLLLHWVLLSILILGIYYALWFVLDTTAQRDFFYFNDWRTEITIDLGVTSLFTALAFLISNLIFRIKITGEKHYLWQLFYTVGIVLINLLLAYSISRVYSLFYIEEKELQVIDIYVLGLIASAISAIHANRAYYRVVLEKEKIQFQALQQKSMSQQLQLDFLKQQINPHFVFNSLNILQGLIEEDTQQADRFLSNMARVYRHMIQNLNKHLITVHEEIASTTHYAYLMNVRYGKALEIIIDPTISEVDEAYIPPSSLQLLIENAIKHNQISIEQPLTIHITHSENNLMVSNPLRPINTPIESLGVGLSNLVGRYRLLCDKMPIIRKSNTHYSVILPLLNIETYENLNHRK